MNLFMASRDNLISNPQLLCLPSLNESFVTPKRSYVKPSVIEASTVQVNVTQPTTVGLERRAEEIREGVVGGEQKHRCVVTGSWQAGDEPHVVRWGEK